MHHPAMLPKMIGGATTSGNPVLSSSNERSFTPRGRVPIKSGVMYQLRHPNDHSCLHVRLDRPLNP